MNQISDTESEPDQFEPIVETLEKKKKKAKAKKAVPPPDAPPVEEPEPVVKPKRVYKKKVAVVEPVAEPVPEPVAEPVKKKRELTENQLKALAEARERRKADKIQLDETSKQILKEAIEAEKPKRQPRKKVQVAEEPVVVEPKPKRVYKKKEAEVAPRPKRQLEVEPILFV